MSSHDTPQNRDELNEAQAIKAENELLKQRLQELEYQNTKLTGQLESALEHIRSRGWSTRSIWKQNGDILIFNNELYQVFNNNMYTFKQPRVCIEYSQTLCESIDYMCSIKPSFGKGDGLFVNIDVEKGSILAVEPLISAHDSIPEEIILALWNRFGGVELKIPQEWLMVFTCVANKNHIPFLETLVEDDKLFEKAMTIEFNKIMIEEIIPSFAVENEVQHIIHVYRKVITNHFGSNDSYSMMGQLACKINSGQEELVEIASIKTDMERVLAYYRLDIAQRKDIGLQFFQSYAQDIDVIVIIANDKLKKGTELCFPYGEAHVH